MVTLKQPLLALNAASLMSRPVVLIPRKMSLPGAAHLLGQAKVSGAPVVNEDGQCIGVISTADFLPYVEKDNYFSTQGKQNLINAWEILEAEGKSEVCVEEVMNHDPVTVNPETPIGVIARMMIDAHIHRVIVVNEKNHPVGIVSSTDILGAVAQADAHW